MRMNQHMRHTVSINCFLDFHVVTKKQAVDSAAHPKCVNAPTPRSTLLDLNTPERICVRVSLQSEAVYDGLTCMHNIYVVLLF